MKKYRVRLLNGRVIGPLVANQFPELLEKKHIDGTEECQLYPAGDWLKLKDFDEISSIIEGGAVANEEDATFIKKITTLGEESEISKEDLLVEEYSLDDDEGEIQLDQFPKKYEYEKKTAFTSRPAFEELESPLGKEDDIVEKKDTLTETHVENKNDSTASASDKTIVNLDTKKYLEELKKQQVQLEKEKLEEEKRKKEEEEQKVDLDKDSTQFIDLSSIKDSLIEDVKATEKDFMVEEKKEKELQKKEEKKRRKAKLKEDQLARDEEDDEEESSGKLKKIIIAFAVLVAVYLVLFSDDGKRKNPKIKLYPPNISFPVELDPPSEQMAQQLHKKAKKLLLNPTYKNKIMASKLLRESVENKFRDNNAAGRLLFVYSQLLSNSNTQVEDSNTIFKLVQIYKLKALTDPLYTTGIANFYYKIQKYHASVKTIESFNDVKKNNPTLELFAVYLRSLLKIGNLVKAQKVSEKLLSVPTAKRVLFVDLALVDYFLFNSNYEKASEIVVDSLKKYPESVPLLLRSAKLILYEEKFDELRKVLAEIRFLAAEYNKIYYSRYLEYRALEFVKKGDVKKATMLFKKALETYESEELRGRLSSLGESSDGDANVLITESKALQLILRSKNYLRENNWKLAFKYALDATRIAPHFVRAKLHLAEISIEQSIFDEAIKTLDGLYKKDPHNSEVLFSLINAYIKAYKFSDAQRLFSILSTSGIMNNPLFYSYRAKYFVYKNDYANALAWLEKAINKNPLDDENIYQLAMMYLKYSKFEKAKMWLNKAMDLDPAKVKYRIALSEILYEMDGSDSAIGYLYDVLQDFPDNPKILSKIGIYHYRSGQQKSYESVKERLLKLPYKDTSLYKFLIEAAKLDDKPQEVIQNSKKLIELDPGDLQTRLELGRIYMSVEKYKEAHAEFKAIESRLETYPKLSYYMSKLFLLTDNNEEAINLAQKEIKFNPSVEDGYILLGDIYRKEKKYLDAEKEYKRAQKINGDNVDMLIGLASVNFKKSQYEISLDLFKKARDLEPSRPGIYKMLGDAYRKTSQSTLAIESYKMFLELSPNSKYKEEIDTYIRMME